MSSALRPKLTVPPASVTPPGQGTALGRIYAATEELCTLTIRTLDGANLNPGAMAQVTIEWCAAAAREQLSLAVRCNGNAIELYSTRRDSKAACAQPLRTIAAWSSERPEFRQLAIEFRRGDDAASALLASAAATHHRRGQATPTQLENVIGVASDAGSLCEVVGSLFRAALAVQRRVAFECLVGNPEPSDVLADLAALCASRIVEEELLVWKTARAEHYRSLSRQRVWSPRSVAG